MNNIYIFGAFGQDGYYLAQYLHKRNLDSNIIKVGREHFQINNNILKPYVYNINSKELRLFLNDLFKLYPPSTIYYLAAIHKSSFQDQGLDNNLMCFTNYIAPLEIACCAYEYNKQSSFIFASSSLIYSGSVESPQTEHTVARPECDYARYKVDVINELKSDKYKDLKVYNLILYNHESIRRKDSFFTSKVIKYALKYNFNMHKGNRLDVYNKHAIIDLSYAQEFAYAMSIIIDYSPGSYILSSNFNTISVFDFVSSVFDFFDVPLKNVEFKVAKERSSTPLIGDCRKIIQEMNWRPILAKQSLVERLCYDHYDSYILHRE